MRKTVAYFLIALLVLVGIGRKPGVLYAQGFGTTWGSTFQVLNLGIAPANIAIAYYNQDGTSAAMESGYFNPQSDTVAVGASNTYNPIRAASGFNGSVVVSSSEPIAIISNVTINTPAQALGSYVGLQQGASKIYFPLVMKGNSFNTTTFNVQNTSSTPGDITITFTPQPGSGYPAVTPINDTLPVGAAHTYNLDTLSAFGSITKWVGSATVAVTDTANDSVGGVANTVNTKFVGAYQLATYNALAAGSSQVNLPLIYENNNGNRTSINCQNIDPSTTADVTVTFTPEAGSAAKASQTVNGVVPNGLAVFLQDYTGPVKWVGAATVTSSPSVPLACVVNQQKPANARLSAYEGFNPASATSKVVLPLIQSRNGPTNVFSTINLATADGNSHPITCDFSPAPGFTDPANRSGTGASVVFSQADIYGNGAKFVGGAVCEITGGGAGLLAIVNQSRLTAPEPIRDVLSTYDGFNVTP